MELIKALCKVKLSLNQESVANVCEELADVEVMLNQMKLIFPGATCELKRKVEKLEVKLITKKCNLCGENPVSSMLKINEKLIGVCEKCCKKEVDKEQRKYKKTEVKQDGH